MKKVGVTETADVPRGVPVHRQSELGDRFMHIYIYLYLYIIYSYIKSVPLISLTCE